MSFKVLVIPEDPTYNGYILKPLVFRIMEECGKPQAKVDVLLNPKTSGYEHAKSLMPDIFERYAHFNLLLFMPDADGKDRGEEFKRMEKDAVEKKATLFCCSAAQEVETWLLAGHLDKIQNNWKNIRKDVSVKENIFNAFLKELGDSRRAGGGRDLLMQKTLRNYEALKTRCPELGELEIRIKNFLEKHPD